MINLTEQATNSHVSPPARYETIVQMPASDHPQTLNQFGAGTFHNITKTIKKNSTGYFCNECNTHYSTLKWVLEDHPEFDTKNFTVLDLQRRFYS